jgi:hypothetical protein
MIAKIYPNGEASLYFERYLDKKKNTPKVEPETRQLRNFRDMARDLGQEKAIAIQNEVKRGGSPIGLVTVPISTKKAESRSGTRGLTRLGARTLRQGAYIIEQRCGKDCTTFGTVTLPDVTDEELEYIEANWSQIVHRFFKRIKYHLEKKKLPSDVIHVTEVQPKRSENEGREIPHIHFVCQGRKRKGIWALTPKMVEKAWKKALGLPYRKQRTFSSSCQLARVKTSVSRYLSKYVAKSRRRISEQTSSMNLRKLCLKQWWGCSNSLRKCILKSTKVRSGSLAEVLWSAHEKEDKTVWEYMGTIESTYSERRIVFCRFGRLTPSFNASIA